MTTLLLLVATLGAIFLLFRATLIERIAAILIFAYWAVCFLIVKLDAPLAQNGFGMADLGLFLAFWALAEWRPRWWLTAAAGFQLVAVITHTLPWFFPEAFLWAAVTIRLGSWVLVLLACYTSAWEARLIRRFSGMSS